VENKLKTIFENVNSWLRFAEAKNGILFATNCALIGGIFQFLDIQKINIYLLIYAWLVIGTLLSSALICSISFVPQLKMPWFFNNSTSESDNLLFFGHLAKYKPYKLLEKLKDTYKITSAIPEFESDYAEQIITNSKITVIKYAYFKLAIWISISALGTPLLALALWLINRHIREEQNND